MMFLNCELSKTRRNGNPKVGENHIFRRLRRFPTQKLASRTLVLRDPDQCDWKWFLHKQDHHPSLALHAILYRAWSSESLCGRIVGSAFLTRALTRGLRGVTTTAEVLLAARWWLSCVVAGFWDEELVWWDSFQARSGGDGLSAKNERGLSVGSRAWMAQNTWHALQADFIPDPTVQPNGQWTGESVR